ncbi:hypothetical protein [Puia dinghuensis]|uniref:Uncharacterized protein n=1 Tax=Puia dinghuensis TaxID=1792502 RepID=A0A8J2XUE1_9BACT|nr:hypothetical protein [Puia dinghuensis]GGB11610.1 hypothetical protein GCM10011511_39050 [Puia dinghuensis]
MKTVKLSLANIQGKLTREEMKNIMAGSGANCRTSGQYCYCSNGIGTCGSGCSGAC